MRFAASAIAMAAVVASCTLAACTQSPSPAPPTPTSAPSAPAPAPPPAAAPAPTPAPPPMPAAAIPARFQGTWAVDAAACATPGHESRLVLSADSVRFHESSGPVRSATANGDDLTLVATLTGEGETREASYRFSLAEGGSALSDRDAGLVRTRCR